MKNLILALTMLLAPIAANAQEAVTTYGSVSRLDSNVGSLVTIQIRSNTPSVFSGSFMQTFNYQNGVTFSSRNFNFSGNANFNVVHTVNTNSFVFTNSPNFKW
jgi:hypothetical protein